MLHGFPYKHWLLVGVFKDMMLFDCISVELDALYKRNASFRGPDNVKDFRLKELGTEHGVIDMCLWGKEFKVSKVS